MRTAWYYNGVGILPSSYHLPGLFPPPFSPRGAERRLTHTQDEILAFHETHFSTHALEHFGLNFLRPEAQAQAHEVYEEDAGEYWEEDEEDDGLGYYEDGVKRTLTDEQIAIFRHSERQTLLRKELKKTNRTMAATATVAPQSEAGLDDGEIDDGGVDVPVSAKPKKNTKKNQKKWKSRGNTKPDLRKRTWDVVEAGLDSLDYGEMGSAETAGPAAQRRRITYDDDD